MDQQDKKKNKKMFHQSNEESDSEALLRSLKGIEVSNLLCDVINKHRATFYYMIAFTKYLRVTH